MAKLLFDTSTLDDLESKDFPEACKFCLRTDCTGCPFYEERLELEAELLLKTEPTLKKYELQQFAYNGRKE
jgi:hypothetical protein